MAASCAFTSGTNRACLPRRRASNATGSTPLTTDCAIQRQFAHETEFLKRGCVDLLAHRDHAQRNGQIEAWAFFLNVGGCKIDRRPAARPEVAAVAHRRRDAIAAFL